MKWPFRQNPPELLKPGECECGHKRCSHTEGTGACNTDFGISNEFPMGSHCACKIYIRDSDNDDSSEPKTPTPSELEKLYNR